MLKCSSPQVMVSVGGAGGEGIGFLYRAGHWEFDHAPVSIWATQIGLDVGS